MSDTFIENEINNSKPLLEESGMQDKAENETTLENNSQSNEEKHETVEEKLDAGNGKQDLNEEKINNPQEETNSTKEETNQKEDENEPNPEWVDLLGSGSIMKKILQEGKPDTRPHRSEKCIINYTLYLEDETIIESASTFELNLGESDVIQGLDVALGLMNVGEKCRLKIEPRLAFGAKGMPPKFSGDAKIVYDVELIAVEPEDDIDLMTIGQRRIKGNKKRERGNWWYTRGESNVAIQCYRRALDYLDEVEGGGYVLKDDGEKSEVSDADLQSILEDRVSVCNNMAAAQIKMENYGAALSSLQIVLKCQPDNVKAHFRKAKAFIGKNDLPTAMKCLLKAKELAPNDPEIQKEINRLNKMLDKQKTTERELARRMFNGPAKSEDADDKKKSRGSKLALWASFGAAVAIGAAGFMAYRFKV